MLPTPIFTGETVRDSDKLMFDKVNEFKAYCYMFQGKFELILRKPRKKRTSKENRYYWGGIVQPIADYTGHKPEEIHEFLKLECNAKIIIIEGVERRIGGSTADMTTIEFEQYLLECRTWAQTFLNLTLPLPNEYE